MAYPSVTVQRSSKLEKPVGGIGEGRVIYGELTGSFRTFQRVSAGSLGLSKLIAIELMAGTPYRAGTPCAFETQGLVINPGSRDNYAHVSCRMKQFGSIRCGTARYQTFNPAYVATPIYVGITPGSPVVGGTDISGGTVLYHYLAYTIDTGSFQHVGSPTVTAYWQSIGPGSVTLYYKAIGY